MRRLLLALMWLAAAPPAAATTFVPVAFPQLVAASGVIVHARVVDVRVVRTAGPPPVETLVTLDALGYLKGQLGPSVTIAVPGGEIGRYRTVFVGAPRFRVGDEVVLFLDARGPRLPWISGLSQGVFRVVRASDGSAPMVTPPPIEAQVHGAAGPVARGDPARRPMALDRFDEAVRAVVEGRP